MLTKILKISFTILLMLTIAEAGYYFFILKQQKTTQAKVSESTSASATPTLALALGSDQTYRTTDAPDRVTRFINTAFYTTIKEISEYNPVKRVDFKINMLIEGKMTDAYDGKKVEEKFPPDPKYPNRTPVVVFEITGTDEGTEAKSTKIMRIVQSELPYLSITDEKGNKLKLEDTIGKNVRINHVIELPVAKKTDIVTLEPTVHNNVVILDEK